MLRKTLTKRQKEVLKYIKKYISKHSYAPSLDEIKNFLNLSSVSTAHYHVQALQNMGYLKKETNHPRAIDVLSDKNILTIPILGTIAAGEPIEAIETHGETVTISDVNVKKEEKVYALRVRGNSMIDEGIFDNDIVIIREQKTADNGQTVVAIIDDNEATLKKIYKEKDRIRLQPSNPTLFPIYRKEVEIRGIVIKVIRNLETTIDPETIGKHIYQRRIDYSWDYKGVKTKSDTHGFHTYPAMFIPQVARRLLQTYSKKGDTICDIFCGSGTALVEARLSGRNSYGIDLNPFAIFLANVKTTEINPKKLTKTCFDVFERIHNIKESDIKPPTFFNIDFWFKEQVIIQLSKIKTAINEIRDKKIRNFLMASFSETVRLCSNTKNGEFKLVRIAKDKLEKYNPDVFGTFRKKTELNILSMSNFYRNVDRSTFAKVIHGDSSQDIGISAESIDFILTSPPYGDSRTTVAYGQFSRLSAQWIDIFENPDEASSVDNKLLGGKPSNDLDHNLKSKYLRETINSIALKDNKRAKDVLSFYIGLEKCLRQAYRMLKPNKYFCLVVGNRLVKQIRIPTDFIIAELSEHIGFSCEDIFVRNIPGKRMPIKNSPTNKAGALEETMTKESIVVLKKRK